MKITNDTRTNRATLAVFHNQLNRTGLALPEMTPPTYEMPPLPTRQDVTAAAFKALQAGKDPATDKEVQRLTTMLHVAEAGLKEHVELEQSKAALRHIEEHAPALIEELADQFTEAVGTMEEVAPIIGHVDLSAGIRFTPGTGTARVVAMAQAAEALNTATIITNVWPSLMDALNNTNAAPGQHARLWHCAPTWEQYVHDQLASRHTSNRHGRHHNVWDMIHDGITVDLATTHQELAERIEALEEQEAEAEREAARRERENRPNYLNR